MKWRWLIHWTWCRITGPNWLVLRIEEGEMDLLCGGCKGVKTHGSSTTNTSTEEGT